MAVDLSRGPTVELQLQATEIALYRAFDQIGRILKPDAFGKRVAYTKATPDEIGGTQ